MSKFDDKFFITPHGRSWRVKDGFICQIDAISRVVLGPGFTTDLESIPRPLRSAVPQKPETAGPAAIHDKIYKSGFIEVRHPTTGNWIKTKVSRKRADQIFNDLMRPPEKVTTKRRRVLYGGVRVGGWAQWNQYRAKH